VLGLFVISTVPFVLRAFKRDPLVALLSPALLAARAWAQVLGVAAGMIYAKGRSQAADRTTDQPVI
jgi:hypothetical protein